MSNSFINNIENILNKHCLLTVDKDGVFIFYLYEPKKIKEILSFLKNNESCLFKLLVDITVVDYPNKNVRFCINYCLLSLKYNIRLVLKVFIDEFFFMPSIVSLYKNSCWLEREVWDTFGIFFEGHPDLRRILTDYGFEGHPLRKDFPLSGYQELRYDDSQKRIIFEAIEMTQEYRLYDFANPWHMDDSIF